MKKKLVWVIAILTILSQISQCSFAQQLSPAIKIAMKKYQKGNYTGCLQDCQDIVQKNPSNAIAYYYMAMSYVQAGKKDEAINAYAKVLSLKPSTQLAGYAMTGKRCIETPAQCKPAQSTVVVTDTSDLDRFIASPSSNNLSNSVKKDYEQKHLDSIKNEINNGKDINDYEFNKVNQADTPIKIAYNDQTVQENQSSQKKPSNDEIVAALKTLNEAGVNPYAQAQTPDMSSQINMLMGGNNQSNNSNAILNMLPFMLSQPGQNGASSTYSPQVMQAVIMNSMMPDFSLNLDKDK